MIKVSQIEKGFLHGKGQCHKWNLYSVFKTLAELLLFAAHVCIPRDRPQKQQQGMAADHVLAFWGTPSHSKWHEMDLASPCMLLPEMSGVMQSYNGSLGGLQTHVCFLWSLGTSLRNSPLGNSLLVGTIHPCCQLSTVPNRTFKTTVNNG